jgi:Ca-activated chloride channel homolog
MKHSQTGLVSKFVVIILFLAISIGFLLVDGSNLFKSKSKDSSGETYTPIENSSNTSDQSLQLKKIEFKKKDCLQTTAIDFVVDRSDTMNDKQDGGTKSKIEYLKEGLNGFLNQMADESIVGLQSFGGEKGSLDFSIDKLGEKREEFSTKIKSIRAGGSTPMYSGLTIAKNELERAKTLYNNYSFSLILLSDGKWNTGGDPTEVVKQIKATGVRIFTVAYGDKTIVDFMKKTASSESDSYYSPGDEQIITILSQIAKKVCE